MRSSAGQGPGCAQYRGENGSPRSGKPRATADPTQVPERVAGRATKVRSQSVFFRASPAQTSASDGQRREQVGVSGSCVGDPVAVIQQLGGARRPGGQRLRQRHVGAHSIRTGATAPGSPAVSGGEVQVVARSTELRGIKFHAHVRSRRCTSRARHDRPPGDDTGGTSGLAGRTGGSDCLPNQSGTRCRSALSRGHAAGTAICDVRGPVLRAGTVPLRAPHTAAWGPRETGPGSRLSAQRRLERRGAVGLLVAVLDDQRALHRQAARARPLARRRARARDDDGA